MIRIGIAGIGFMGKTHFDAWKLVNGGKVSAISTRNEKKLAGDWSAVRGNFGGTGSQVDLSDIEGFRSLDDMIASPNVDVIDICLTTPMHVDTAIKAMEAGKHVIVEKPIALTVAEADRVIDASKSTGQRLFVGQVLRFMPEWAYIKSLMESGEYGTLNGLNIQRVISVPDWSDEMSDLAANGGPLIDLHIHDTDFVTYLLGRPSHVFSTGRRDAGCITYVATNYIYPDGPTVTAQSGALASKGREFMHAFEAYFDKATLTHSVATEPESIDAADHQSGHQRLTVYHDDGAVTFPSFEGVDGFASELQHIVDCIIADKDSDIVSGQQARDSLALVLLEGESVSSGRIVAVE